METVCTELDDTVLQIFQVLEELYSEHERLEKLMKDGYLGISRTRYSLGVKRVSSDQFVDADIAASRTVLVKDKALEKVDETLPALSEDIFEMCLTDRKNGISEDNYKEGETQCAKTLTANTSNVTSTSGLRQRKAPSAEIEATHDQKDKKEKNEDTNSKGKWSDLDAFTKLSLDNSDNDEDEEENRPVVTNPLQLFGVLVPQHLRSSKVNFEEALVSCVRIGNLKHRLVGLQSVYKEQKKQKEKLKEEEENALDTEGSALENES